MLADNLDGLGTPGTREFMFATVPFLILQDGHNAMNLGPCVEGDVQFTHIAVPFLKKKMYSCLKT